MSGVSRSRREGEELVSIESLFLFPEQETVVTGNRGRKPAVMRYLPAGPKRDGFVWVRLNGVPDERCRQR